MLKYEKRYPNRLPVADDIHKAILKIHDDTKVPVYIVADSLLRLALKVKRIPIKGEVS
jgi:hypothetical protein